MRPFLTPRRQIIVPVPFRHTLAIAAALCIVLVGACRRAPSPPDVVLITVDTLRADRVGCYGDREGTTPEIDRLCAESARFDPALSPAPLTLPAHATMMTGLLPPEHGLRNNGAFALAPRFTTIAEVLAARGYATAAFVAALPLERRTGLDQGFAVYDDQLPPGRGDFGYAERPAGAIIDRALSWWGQQDSRPRFLWVHLFEPHDPYEPPADARARFPEDPYRGEVFTADREVGRLFAALRASGDWYPTIVALTSDHGESLGEHGEKTHGLLPYEATLRVPMIVKGAAQAPRGLQGPATLADLAPTLLALSGTPSTGMRGRSLFDARARGGFEAYGEAVAPALDFNWAPLFALRRGTWKIVSGPEGKGDATGDALYDLAGDPHETRNVAREHPQHLSQLRDALRRLRDALERAPDPQASRAVDSDTHERLAALGYTAGGGHLPAPDPDARHPVDMLWLAEEINDASDLSPDALDTTIPRLEALARQDPRNHLIARRLATAYQRRGDHAAAARSFTRAHNLGYRDERLVREALSLFVRAAAAEDEAGRGRRAWALLSEAHALDAGAPAVREARATWLARHGRGAEARIELEALVKRAPERASAWRQLGLLYLSERRYAPAVEALATARRLHSDPDTLFALGEAYHLAGDVPRSREAFRAFLTSAPGQDVHRRRHATDRLR